MTQGSSLTDEELAVLGVTRRRSKLDNHAIYEIPCALCGRTAYSRTYSTVRVYKCRMCEKEIVKKRNARIQSARAQFEELLADEIGTDAKHVRRFDKGAAKFGRTYAKSIETARKAIEDYDSVPEVVACIELLHIGTRVIVHQPVGDYTVDFCLPVEKLVVEIDGSLYHNDKDKEYMRDYAIKYMLGSGWEVRHIPADSVMKNHSLFGRGMKKLLNTRRVEFGVDTL